MNTAFKYTPTGVQFDYVKPTHIPVPTLMEKFTTQKTKLMAQFQTLIKDVDRQSLVVGAGIITAVGISGMLFWQLQRKGAPTKKADFGVEGSTTPVKIESTGTLASAEGNANEKPRILVLHQCPRGRKSPCIAPYPLKLETFLRVHAIEYEVDFTGSEPKDQASPWITLDSENVSDSHNCLEFIASKYGLELEKDILAKDKAVSRAYSHLLEHHLYWGIALWRWVYDGARSLGSIQILPAKTVSAIPDVCRTVEQAAWFHGLGKKKPQEAIDAVLEDLKALSHYLGTKKYFLGGQKATELDCTAFAMLAQMLWNMDGSPFAQAVKESHQNLADFCWRMRVRYWPDWENCLNNSELPEE